MTKVRTFLISAIAGLFLFLGISSCAPSQSPVAEQVNSTPVAISSPTATAQADAKPSTPNTVTYKFGVPPWRKDLTLDDVRGKYKPLLEWLSKEVGAQFEIVGAKDYEESSDLLATGKVQIARLGPAGYIASQRKNPDVSLVVAELTLDKATNQNVDFYLGHILTLKSRNDINNVEDLKGKKFGFVSKTSTSGYLIPNAVLKTKGIKSESYFEKIFFLGSHPLVTDAIASGSIDGGATDDFNFKEAATKHGDIFKSILVTPPIPNPSIAAHPSLPTEMKKKIQTALTKVDASLLKGLGVQGYVIKPESFYDPIRSLQEN